MNRQFCPADSPLPAYIATVDRSPHRPALLSDRPPDDQNRSNQKGQRDRGNAE